MTIKPGGYWPGYAAGMSIYWTSFIKGQTTDPVDVGTESIPYPINIVAATGGPTTPVISGGACTVGTPYSISFT